MAAKGFAAQVTWAQRKDRLYLTIDVQDCIEPKIDLSNIGGDEGQKHGHVSFRGEGRSHATGSDKHNYTLDLDLNKVRLALPAAFAQVSVAPDRASLEAADAARAWPAPVLSTCREQSPTLRKQVVSGGEQDRRFSMDFCLLSKESLF